MSAALQDHPPAPAVCVARERFGWLPPSLYRIALRTFSSPVLTSDQLLIEADLLREWARGLPRHFTLQTQLLRLADLYAEAAPEYADVPLPGPLGRRLPVHVLRAAARDLRAWGGKDSDGAPELLNDMADALDGRRP